MMKPLILIVEDEPAIAENIKYALSTEGFETDWHYCGSHVMEYIRDKHVSLIVLDVGLPDINGMELCKQIRVISDVPIIFLTARADEIDRIVGLEIGADDYMVKPFSPRELSARVKAVLRRTRDLGSPDVMDSLSGFHVDERKMKIYFDSNNLDLSRYEYRILKILMARPGQIFSREKLMEMVWDDPGMSMDRAIDAHIKNIRGKMKKIKPDLDPIQTHRSVGYSFKEEQ